MSPLRSEVPAKRVVTAAGEATEPGLLLGLAEPVLGYVARGGVVRSPKLRDQRDFARSMMRGEVGIDRLSCEFGQRRHRLIAHFVELSAPANRPVRPVRRPLGWCTDRGERDLFTGQKYVGRA